MSCLHVVVTWCVIFNTDVHLHIMYDDQQSAWNICVIHCTCDICIYAIDIMCNNRLCAAIMVLCARVKCLTWATAQGVKARVVSLSLSLARSLSLSSLSAFTAFAHCIPTACPQQSPSSMSVPACGRPVTASLCPSKQVLPAYSTVGVKGRG